MSGPRYLRSLPAVTLALAWLPAAGGLTATTVGGACFVVTSMVSPHAEAAPPSAPPETTPPRPSKPATSPTPPPAPTTVRARTSPPPAPRSGDSSGGSAAGGSSVAPVSDGPPQDLSGNWGYSKSRARTPRYVRTDVSDVVSAANPIGFYSGVSVAGNHVPPRPPTNFNSKPTLLTWAGFERAHEGSRVFLQLNAVAQYSVEHNGQVIVVRLRNTKVNVRNNLRALDLRYFKTPVQSVKVRRKGKDTIARIVLKRAASPQIEIIDGKEGYKLLVVQFSDALETSQRVNPTQKRQVAPKVNPLPASSGS